MLKRINGFLKEIRNNQRLALGMAKGHASRSARVVDPTRPATWEFSGLSQNGEDGIIDVLRSRLRQSNRYCVEIGAASGVQNNTAWLICAHNYNGLLIEGDAELVAEADRTLTRCSIGLQYKHMFVTLESVQQVVQLAQERAPDLFSLDIDGNDYHIAQALLAKGMRPKIFVVEYNSAFGAERSETIAYNPTFSFKQAHPTWLYYGVSIAAWKKLFAAQGYRFVTVDQNGVNGFFVDPQHFEPEFLDGIKELSFAENRFQYTKFGGGHDRQYPLIADQKLVQI
jgi:hypothetical protein